MPACRNGPVSSNVRRHTSTTAHTAPLERKFMSSIETLKNLDQLIVPDQRNLNLSLADKDGKPQKLTIELWHQKISETKLHQGVPARLVDHFSQAQNLTLYAWYNYQFHAGAQLLCCASLEMSLREKLKNNGMLRSLLKKAIDDGIFPNAELRKYVCKMPSDPLPSELLLATLPQIRNGFAHGADSMNPFSITTLRVVSTIVNSLFPLPAK